MIEVWERGPVVKIVAGAQSIDIDRNDVPHLIDELTAYAKQGRWTSAEIKQLVQLFEQGKRTNEIAVLLGRTRQSLSNKLWQLKRVGALG